MGEWQAQAAPLLRGGARRKRSTSNSDSRGRQAPISPVVNPLIADLVVHRRHLGSGPSRGGAERPRMHSIRCHLKLILIQPDPYALVEDMSAGPTSNIEPECYTER